MTAHEFRSVTPPYRRRAARAGFSLVEMVVAMGLTLVVFAITLPFVRSQSRALGANAGRLDAEQIARYAQRAIDRELRLAQADPGQPRLVYAGPLGIAFNANVLGRDTLDISALELELGASEDLTDAWAVADAAYLPLTTTTYPTEDYVASDGTGSRVETVMYYLEPDTVQGRTDLYVLYRRVNAQAAIALVRGVHVPTDSAFFSYLRPDTAGLAEIPAGELPLFWTDPEIDDIRVVGLRASGWFRNRQEESEVIRTVRWRTTLPEEDVTTNCVAVAPAAPSNVLWPGGAPTPYQARITWTGSADDVAGATTVTHYDVMRRLDADSVWQRVRQMPALGVSSYEFIDAKPILSGSYRYGVAAVGCAGDRSAVVASNQARTLP